MHIKQDEVSKHSVTRLDLRLNTSDTKTYRSMTHLLLVNRLTLTRSL